MSLFQCQFFYIIAYWFPQIKCDSQYWEPWRSGLFRCAAAREWTMCKLFCFLSSSTPLQGLRNSVKSPTKGLPTGTTCWNSTSPKEAVLMGLGAYELPQSEMKSQAWFDSLSEITWAKMATWDTTKLHMYICPPRGWEENWSLWFRVWVLCVTYGSGMCELC